MAGGDTLGANSWEAYRETGLELQEAPETVSKGAAGPGFLSPVTTPEKCTSNWTSPSPEQSGGGSCLMQARTVRA